MKEIFYKKGLTRVLIALTLVLVLLLFVLITFLSQKASFDAKLAELEKLLTEAQTEQERLEQKKKYQESDEYIWQWAVNHGMVNEEDSSWIPSSK